MGLRISTTGLDQYAPGGTARVKVLVIGGPGVGKTRSASFWPKPIYADCEGGLASVADRKVPFVTINTSQDMLDFLEFLKVECRRPDSERRFETAVIDTLDTFQRKVKDEWLQAHPNASSFSGYDAWGYLDAKMQMLMTRLLNLDMNIYVAVHYTDKTITEGSGENAKQRQEIQLQLSGSIKDQAFNDFDLVGWMGKYYEAVDGQRVEKRGLTFKPGPDKPFLKDRLNVTPPWLEITFTDEDYTKLWLGVIDRLDAVPETEQIGEIPTAREATASGVVSPDAVGDSTLPPVDPKDIPLVQFDKPTLQKIARDEGVTLKVDGTKIASNTLKGELVAAIEAHRQKKAAAATAPEAEATAQAPEGTEAAPEATATEQAPAEATAPAAEPATEPTPTPAEAQATPEPSQADSAPVESTVAAGGETVQVDTSTGEVKATEEVTPEKGIENAVEGLGAEVVKTQVKAEPQSEQPAAEPQQGGKSLGPCESCGTDLDNEKPDYVKLAYIKYRSKLCENCYRDKKAGK